MKNFIKVIALLFSVQLLVSCGSGFQSTFPEEKPVSLPQAGKGAPRVVGDKVVFTYTTKGKKKSVNLAGTFNNWDKENLPMQEISEGVWQTSLALKEGKYEYKFYINGSMWVADRDNPAVTSDGWGNSIIIVDQKGQVKLMSVGLSEKYPSYLYANTAAPESPQWIKDAVIYELFPRTFTSQGYQGLIKKLDYLADLGVTTLWIMPTFPIGKKNRKGSLGSPYSVKDYTDINPEFGTKKDFKAFVEGAHNRGMKVILDWVPNHTAWDNDLTKKHPEFYLKDAKGNIQVPPDTDWTDVAQLDYSNEGLREYMISALKYWVTEFGVDGYRMDVAGRVPHSFWDQARSELAKVRPDLLLLAESEEPEHHLHGFDLTYSGSVKGVVQGIARSSQKQHDFFQVYNKQKYNFPKKALRMNWMENHDQVHALKNLGAKAIYPGAVIHLTMDGVPLILMGQEIGDTNWQDWHSLFDPVQLDWEHSDTNLQQFYKSLIHLRREHPALLHGDLQLIQTDQEKVVAYVRIADQEAILVVVNLSAKPHTVNLKPADLKKAGFLLKKGLTLKSYSPGVEKDSILESLPLELAPWQSLILMEGRADK